MVDCKRMSEVSVKESLQRVFFESKLGRRPQYSL